MTADHDTHGAEPLTAGILAGGSASRMGRPKGLLVLPGGATLIEHSVRVAQGVAGETVILGARDPVPPALAGLKILPDAQPDGGPLAGLCALLEHALGEWTLLLACDMPHLRPALVERLVSERTTAADAVLFEQLQRPDSYHPCCALYHARVLAVARSQLAKGERRMHALLRLIRKKVLSPAPGEAAMLANVNTPQTWEEVCREGPAAD